MERVCTCQQATERVKKKGEEPRSIQQTLCCNSASVDGSSATKLEDSDSLLSSVLCCWAQFISNSSKAAQPQHQLNKTIALADPSPFMIKWAGDGAGCRSS
jgi:hypothetical protein